MAHRGIQNTNGLSPLRFLLLLHLLYVEWPQVWHQDAIRLSVFSAAAASILMEFGKPDRFTFWKAYESITETEAGDR